MDSTEAIEPAAAEPVRTWPQSIVEFDALIEAMQHRLVQFAFCRLHSLEDAEDVVQEVFVRAYRDRARHQGVDNAAPYLYRMVSNRCTDLLRKRKYAAGPLEDLAREPAAETAVGRDSQRQRWIEGLLTRLPSRQAEVIRLRVYGELPFDAVAQSLGCSVPTVKSRFRYGIQKLRKALQRAGGER
jgi:RNA polymerase sigma-70 factor (ECF subfamily)